MRASSIGSLEVGLEKRPEDIIHAFSIARPLQVNRRIRTGFHVHIVSTPTSVDGVECAKEYGEP